ncbi:MAG: hypothetical protein ACR2FM_04955 [Candidatus Saccharimonadales bacterium]
MAIKWFNIRSKEVRVAESEPQISAMWASSDHSPNITQGQDFGWRLAPEVVVDMKRIKQDQNLLLDIAKRYQIMSEDLDEKVILQYISDKTPIDSAPIAGEGDYQDEYDAEVRRLSQQAAENTVTSQTATTTTTESLADMEKRAELAERIAKANKAGKMPTTVKPRNTTTLPNDS